MKEPAILPSIFGKEVQGMENFYNFILSVIAGIYSYFIYKWLDGKK